MESHEPFLREAIALSKSAMERGDEPFGSVLVKDGEVILRAENSVFTGHDMTNHADHVAALDRGEPSALAFRVDV